MSLVVSKDRHRRQNRGIFTRRIMKSPGELQKPRSIDLSNEKNPGCLGNIGDYTAQLYGDYNKPL